MKALEEKRSQGVIGSPLEARITILFQDNELARYCEAHIETLCEVFVVSQVKVQQEKAGQASHNTGIPGLVDVKVERAPGNKCDRCWKHLQSVGSLSEHPSLCARCAGVVVNSKT